MAAEFVLPDFDKAAFARELDALRADLMADLGQDDIKHLRKMTGWGRLCSALGYLTAWIAPNPVSALLMSQGIMFRWIVMHHVGHRGYDKVPGIPPHLTSKRFARGPRRFVDWFDWILPEAWCHEHNDLHHMYTAQPSDPDLVERDMKTLRALNIPLPAKDFAMFFFACTWKYLFMTPTTLRALHLLKRRRAGDVEALSAEESLSQFYDLTDPRGLAEWRKLFSPFSPEGRQLWFECFLPYSVVRFGAVPAVFGLILGPWAWFSVFVNSIIADIFANLIGFVTIAPNHTGDDIPRFEGAPRGKADWYVRQVVSSVNFHGGTDLQDFLHGYLNYHIEHHLWPDLPMLKYQQAQPRVEAICKKYGVPYVRESVWRRLGKVLSVMTGRTSPPIAVRTATAKIA